MKQAYANDVVHAHAVRRRPDTGVGRLQAKRDRQLPKAMPAASKQILVEYEKAPAVTRERMYIDMMQQVMGNVSKVMVDQKKATACCILPLDKLIETSRTAGAAADALPVTSHSSDNTAHSAPRFFAWPRSGGTIMKINMNKS